MTFVKLGRGACPTYHYDITDSLLLGRDPGLCQFAVPEDELLSNTHCKITHEKGVLHLVDLGSTNGTYCNGIPVTQPTELHSGDVILLGSMELKVSW